MKKTLITLTISVLAVYTSNAQHTFSNSGTFVGINTTSPSALLEINTNGHNPGLLVSGNSSNYKDIRMINTSNGKLWQWSYRAADYEPENLEAYHYNGSSWVMTMALTPAGNVGIGTTTPAEKLSVNGKIRAKEIKVETANWPDYVFSREHSLRSLGDLERYIQTNRHLPEIPSAEEVKKDGISLGEMNAKLLKKIEELTLYILQQEKRIQSLEINQQEVKPK